PRGARGAGERVDGGEALDATGRAPPAPAAYRGVRHLREPARLEDREADRHADLGAALIDDADRLPAARVEPPSGARQQGEDERTNEREGEAGLVPSQRHPFPQAETRTLPTHAAGTARA